MTTVQGRCPACRSTDLFLGDGGHVTCSWIDCPNPCAADDFLRGERTDAMAGEILRRTNRIEELFAEPDRREDVLSNVRGEVLGLRAALGIALGASVPSGGEDVALGEAYYRRWLAERPKAEA